MNSFHFTTEDTESTEEESAGFSFLPRVFRVSVVEKYLHHLRRWSSTPGLATNSGKPPRHTASTLCPTPARANGHGLVGKGG